MPQDMGGLPPGADVESQRPRYRNERGLFPVPQTHIATSRQSLSEEMARHDQCEIRACKIFCVNEKNRYNLFIQNGGLQWQKRNGTLQTQH